MAYTAFLFDLSEERSEKAQLSLAHEGWLALRFYPYLMVFPGIAIFLTVLAFNFVGEGLQGAIQGRRK